MSNLVGRRARCIAHPRQSLDAGLTGRITHAQIWPSGRHAGEMLYQFVANGENGGSYHARCMLVPSGEAPLPPPLPRTGTLLRPRALRPPGRPG